ncbi:Protein lifeguard 3 [Anabarilius grahami]|uniref:Protein lifeguard 3 n=1 Tax=Anabarilius grahami TaxID=495550 RepID=A0A3N0Z2H6_ANAGA|nr:Protein lifeguard 3 [Anabarilius grahami]
MSKSDPPPSYEESRQQHGNYPYPPYGYPAQPGVYTGPGQPGIHPQAGLWHGPGYPPPAMPSLITPGMFSSNLRDAEGISSTGVWDSMSVRHAFIRKTLTLSYMTGTISSYFDTKAVFLALGITAIVCVIVTVFCFQTKVDFTSCTGLLCALCVVVLVTGIITSIVLSFQYVPWLHMLYGACGAIVFTLFLAYHTQLLIGNRANAISPEEYVFGALSLYVDIVQIFIFLLHITGSSE